VALPFVGEVGLGVHVNRLLVALEMDVTMTRHCTDYKVKQKLCLTISSIWSWGHFSRQTTPKTVRTEHGPVKLSKLFFNIKPAIWKTMWLEKRQHTVFLSEKKKPSFGTTFYRFISWILDTHHVLRRDGRGFEPASDSGWRCTSLGFTPRSRSTFTRHVRMGRSKPVRFSCLNFKNSPLFFTRPRSCRQFQFFPFAYIGSTWIFFPFSLDLL